MTRKADPASASSVWPRDLVELFRRALAHLEPSQRRQWLTLWPMAVLLAISEAGCSVAVLAVLRRMALVGMSGTSTDPPLQVESLVWPCVGAGVLYVLRSLLRLFEVLLRQRVAARSVSVVRQSLVERLLGAPWIWHVDRHSTRTIRQVLDAPGRVYRVLLVSLMGLVVEGSTLLVVTGAALVMAPGAAILAAVPLAALTALALRATLRSHRQWGSELHRIEGQLAKEIAETFASLKQLKVMNLEIEAARRLAVHWGDLEWLKASRGTAESVPRVLVETVFMLAVLSTIALFGVLGGRHGDLVPLLGLAAYTGMRLLPSIHLLAHHLNEVQFYRSSLDEMEVGYEQPCETGMATSAIVTTTGVPGPGPTTSPSLVLRDVGFTYPGAREPSLVGVDLRVRAGECLGLIGPSGSGKSTLLDVVLGLLTPTTGSLTVEASGTVRVGYVSQDVVLVDASIAENICLGVAPESVDMKLIEEVIAEASLDQFVGSLPDGVHTRVGERGVALSGGQRQRIAVARALYRRPNLLVLDEATSAQDGATEAEIAITTRRLRGHVTMLVVTHHRALLDSCDRLISMQGGRVVTDGPVSEVLARHPDLVRLVRGESPPGARFSGVTRGDAPGGPESSPGPGRTTPA